MVMQSRATPNKKLTQLLKNQEPIPITEMTTSVGDHHTNRMDFVPIEQKLLYLILDELREIRKLLNK